MDFKWFKLNFLTIFLAEILLKLAEQRERFCAAFLLKLWGEIVILMPYTLGYTLTLTWVIDLSKI